MIGDNIKSKRKESKITQERLADVLGLRDRSTIAKWETNVYLPRADKLAAIADALGCSVDEILRGA